MSNDSMIASAEASIDDPGVDEFCHIVAGIVRRLIVGHTGQQTQDGTSDKNPTPIVPSTSPLGIEHGDTR
jgi:hypothetical protein